MVRWATFISIAAGFLAGCDQASAPPRLDWVVPAFVDGREEVVLKLRGSFPPAVTVDMCSCRTTATASEA
jgi:hypothetical protein